MYKALRNNWKALLLEIILSALKLVHNTKKPKINPHFYFTINIMMYLTHFWLESVFLRKWFSCYIDCVFFKLHTVSNPIDPTVTTCWAKETVSSKRVHALYCSWVRTGLERFGRITFQNGSFRLNNITLTNYNILLSGCLSFGACVIMNTRVN